MSGGGSGGRVPPPTRLPGLMTTPMSWVYRAAINRRNRAYDAGKGVTRLDRPVLSVGNLSTGGTGKTPVVHRMVQMLESQGHRPVIAMRGYGAKPDEKGDEQREHELALPGVPIVAQPDRLAGLRALFKTHAGGESDCVVLDDGFQHRQIARDLDIVLIDASRPPDRDALLPHGHLREPIGSLSRAGLILLTHAERVGAGELDRLRQLIGQYNSQAPVIAARHVWRGFAAHTRTVNGWTTQTLMREGIAGTRMRVVCGIGNTAAFLDMVRANSIEIDDVIELRDHAAIGPPEVARLTQSQNSQAPSPVVMTRKDWVKAETLRDWPISSCVIVPELSIEFDDPGSAIDRALRAVFPGR